MWADIAELIGILREDPDATMTNEGLARWLEESARMHKNVLKEIMDDYDGDEFQRADGFRRIKELMGYE